MIDPKHVIFVYPDGTLAVIKVKKFQQDSRYDSAYLIVEDVEEET